MLYLLSADSFLNSWPSTDIYKHCNYPLLLPLITQEQKNPPTFSKSNFLSDLLATMKVIISALLTLGVATALPTTALKDVNSKMAPGYITLPHNFDNDFHDLLHDIDMSHKARQRVLENVHDIIYDDNNMVPDCRPATEKPDLINLEEFDAFMPMFRMEIFDEVDVSNEGRERIMEKIEHDYFYPMRNEIEWQQSHPLPVCKDK